MTSTWLRTHILTDSALRACAQTRLPRRRASVTAAAVSSSEKTARKLPVWGSLKRRTSSPERRSNYDRQHTRIVTALSERDPAEAEDAMHARLRDVSDNMLGLH
jgi:DNA-binding FadR family transcriptional regulator